MRSRERLTLQEILTLPTGVDRQYAGAGKHNILQSGFIPLCSIRPFVHYHMVFEPRPSHTIYCMYTSPKTAEKISDLCHEVSRLCANLCNASQRRH